MLISFSQMDLLIFKLTSDKYLERAYRQKTCIFLKLCFEGSYIIDVSYCIAQISHNACSTLTKPISCAGLFPTFDYASKLENTAKMF